MTCIVGYEYGGRVYIGGDVQGTGPNNKIIHTQPKVFSKKGIVFGYTTAYRFGQVIEHCLPDPVIPDKAEDVYRWLITVLVPDIKLSLKAAEFDGGGQCLIGIKDQLWELQSDFSVLRSVKGYAAVGSGCEYALGSVYGILTIKQPVSEKDVHDTIATAIRAAGENSPSVGVESTILST